MWDRTEETVSAARHAVVDQLREWGIDDADPGYAVLDTIALVVTELASNAVKAGSGPIVVELEAHRPNVEVRVIDDSHETPFVRAPGPSESGGRGLMIVQALSEHWGFSVTKEGKIVWARIAVDERSALGEGCTL